MKLADKTAIVTGGGRGIGRAIALALAREGANVVVSARTQSEIDAVAAEIQILGRKALAIAADATQFPDVKKLAERTHSEFGRIDILVNNAGGIPSELYNASGTIEMPQEVWDVSEAAEVPQGVWDVSEAAWDSMIEVNVKSAFLCMKAIMPYMMVQGYGDVINIASGMGRRIVAQGSAYGVAKHAVMALTQHAALQAASHGVRVNAVSPGKIDTPGLRRLMAALMPEDQFPPMGAAEEVAAGVLFLLCDASRSMTGQSIDLFGIE